MSPTQVGNGNDRYEWIDAWAQIPASESATAGWAHHGVVVTEDDEVIAYHQGDPTVLVFDRAGRLLRQFESGLLEAHGMALASDGGTEYLWIADPGAKRMPEFEYDYPPGDRVGHVAKMSLDGQTVLNVEQPSLSMYDGGVYSPTSMTVF